MVEVPVEDDAATDSFAVIKDQKSVPAPKGTWIGGAVVVAVVLGQVAVLLAFWILSGPSSKDSVQPTDEVVEVAVGKPVSQADIKGKLRVEILPGAPTPSPGYTGIVTAMYVGTGGTASSGTRLFSLDGIDRYGYHAERPFYRVLKEGDSGPDVVQLRQLLNDVGVGPVSVRRDTFDYMVSAAVTKWTKKLGLARQPVTTAILGPTRTAIDNNGSPATTTTAAGAAAATTATTTTAAAPTEPGTVKTVGAIFDPQWTVWLPSPSVSIDKSNVKVGLALPLAGTPMYTSARTLGTVTLSSDSPLPRLSVPVSRTFEIEGASIPIKDDRVLVTAANGASIVRAALAVEPEPTKPVMIDGNIRSHVSSRSVSVPVAAIYEAKNGKSCVAVKNGGKYTGRVVSVVASSAASGQATVDGLSSGLVVVANPTDSGNEPEC